MNNMILINIATIGIIIIILIKYLFVVVILRVLVVALQYRSTLELPWQHAYILYYSSNIWLFLFSVHQFHRFQLHILGSSICCTFWAINPHWWLCGVSGVYCFTKFCVWSYSTGSNLFITSNACLKVLH